VRGIYYSQARSFDWWLIVSAALFWEKCIVGCLLMSSDWFVLREKYYWMMVDKSDEKADKNTNGSCINEFFRFQNRSRINGGSVMKLSLLSS
jgi:hypothetical protein